MIRATGVDACGNQLVKYAPDRGQILAQETWGTSANKALLEKPSIQPEKFGILGGFRKFTW